jgi:hypothetical protein
MKDRILKKLCKRASEYVPDCKFDKDIGEIGFWYKTSYWDDEWDFKNAWDELRNLFWDAFTEYSEDDMKYIGKKATPINVFKWAKNERIQQRSYPKNRDCSVS